MKRVESKKRWMPETFGTPSNTAWQQRRAPFQPETLAEKRLGQRAWHVLKLPE